MASKPKKQQVTALGQNLPADSNMPVNEAPMQSDVATRAAMEDQMLAQHEQAEAMKAQMPKKIGEKEVKEASQILRKYREGKVRLESKIIANEEFWKLRQWNYHHDTDQAKKEFEPATAWLWNCIQNRHADLMDSYPTCNFQPRQEDDKAEAKKLSAIVPVILEQNRFEEVYSDLMWYFLKNGGIAVGVFWDGSKNNGLGDVAIKKLDFLNLFWEPGITDIQESANVFTTELVSNKILEQRYPQTVGHLGGKKITLSKYLYDDHVDTTDKSIVVDWYYKTEYNGKKAIHYCKFVNDIVLYATENETSQPTQTQIDPMTGKPLIIPTGEAMSVSGLYNHAMYPFIVQQLYPVEGSLCGYGLTDIGRDTQIQIDIMNKAITDNVVASAKPRYFASENSGVNEEEFLDMYANIVHVAGSVNDDHVRAIEVNPLTRQAISEMRDKVEELKTITSCQDVNNGSAPSGITAASAIAALQETAGKSSRDANKAAHRAFREICYMMVELIRQFYDQPRTFRIAPDVMGEQFVQFDNSGLKPQPQMIGGNQNGFRLPEFDIDITAEKANPYKKMEQNELALNFYNQGFFNPQMADQAIACLQMMDFNKKEEVIQRIQKNGTMMQLMLQFQQLALTLAQKYEPQTADQIGQMILSQGGQPIPQGGEVDLNPADDEHPFVEKSRSQARASTQAE